SRGKVLFAGLFCSFGKKDPAPSIDIYVLSCSIRPINLATEKEVPPLLPEVGGSCFVNGRWRLFVVGRLSADNDDGVFAGTDIAELLACFVFDYRRVTVLFHLILELLVMSLKLVQFLLSVL